MSYGGVDSTAPLPQVLTGASASENGVHQSTESQRDIGDEPVAQSTFRQNLKGFYERNFGLFLVFLAQTCGSVVGGFNVCHY